MYCSTALVVLSSMLALISAAPMSERAASIEVRASKATFNVTNFSWTKNSTASSYSFNVTFPQGVSVANVPANQPIYAIPGFTTPVTCTGSLVGSTSKNSSTLTTINVCGQPPKKPMEVRAQLDTAKGQLFLTYIYHANINGQAKDHVYQGNQTALKPVDAKAAISFVVPVTTGPGVSS